MQPSYLSLSTRDLLTEFGAGKHIPGAGSAAALSGLIAAQLTLTVCKLTLEKDEYADRHASMQQIHSRIELVVIPELEKLLDDDAIAFGKVYVERVAQRDALDEQTAEIHRAAKIALLKPATAIPFKIAEYCLELIGHAGAVFEHGLRHVRGDSGVALSTAFSGVLSSVFVINLNLKEFKQTAWAIQRRKDCDQLQRDATTRYQAITAQLRDLRTEVTAAVAPVEGTEAILGLVSRSKQNYTNEEIEDRARKLGLYLWQQQKERSVSLLNPVDPIRLLDPENALGALGYSFELDDTLGVSLVNGANLEVAGILEAQSGRVRVSKQMAPEVRLFTAAHELGHVLLHPHLREAHRDRPLDGSEIPRDPTEREANRFAAAFLMPAKLVRAKFSQIFGSAPFQLSEATAYALLSKDMHQARKKIKNPRDLSFELARAQRYNGKPVTSLAEQFRVSVMAMAIRLEELGLV